MPKISLTDAYLRKLKPSGRREEITDALTTGLRVRVSATGQVTFLLKSRDAAGKLQTVTLGHYPDISLKVARDRAARNRLELKSGGDINARKRSARLAATQRSIAPSLRELLREYEAAFGSKKIVWAPAGPRTERSQAGRVIERVFASMLDKDVTSITEEEFGQSIMSYRRVRQSDGKQTANGQVSKARLYLGPVLDWAAGRKSYAKIGAARMPRLGSRLIDFQSQKITVAASAMAERNTFGHLS